MPPQISLGPTGTLALHTQTFYPRTQATPEQELGLSPFCSFRGGVQSRGAWPVEAAQRRGRPILDSELEVLGGPHALRPGGDIGPLASIS